MSVLRPILKAHFCRNQCANDNPTTQVVFSYNCFVTIISFISKVYCLRWRSIESTSHPTLKSFRVNRSLGRILLVSAGFKDKRYTIFTCITRTALCCGHLALSTSSKVFPTQSGKHGPSEKLESWRQARSARGEAGTSTDRERGAIGREKDCLRPPLSLITNSNILKATWSRVTVDELVALYLRCPDYYCSDNFFYDLHQICENFSLVLTSKLLPLLLLLHFIQQRHVLRGGFVFLFLVSRWAKA